MDIIPVIDLKGGQAVHARQGERDTYEPVRSRLCPGSDVVDVARGYVGVYPFSILYVADLDAIQGHGDNLQDLERLRGALPDLRLWVDSGHAEDSACRAWLARGLGDLVIGSESLADGAPLTRLGDEIKAGRVVLSLDFQGDRFLGPAAVLARPEIWPDEVIVITLSRVGSGRGPDLERLGAIRAKANSRRVYAGGGARDADDLWTLRNLGLAGALVATALHEGRINRAEIERLHAAPPSNPVRSVSED